MPYKDTEKQKEANKEKSKRYRDKHKGVMEGVTQSEGVTVDSPGVTEGITALPGVGEGTSRSSGDVSFGENRVGSTPPGVKSLVTHPDVLKAASELGDHKFNYLGSYYYWNAGTVREQLRALPPPGRIR